MDLQRTKKQWQQRQLPADFSDDQTRQLARDLGLPERIVRILALRGFRDKNEINSFLAPCLSHLPRPNLMKGMDQAVAILLDALKFQKPVTVYGDFDADGVTSTAVLSMFFTELGVPLKNYIPDRMTEGYGLNHEAVNRLYNENKQEWNEAGVLLTADCGISDADVVAEAKRLGFRVIITDHHKPPEILPQADAIINPLQQDCRFPCKNLAGVGVAFYLILGMRSELMDKGYWPEDKIPNLKSYMDLVAIGTVADQVPLTDCNRIIVKAGLEILNQAGRIGVQTLQDNTKCSRTNASTEDIAFRMAPRINAIGRIGSAQKAVKLLTTRIFEEAQNLADELEKANNDRKSIEATIYNEAVNMVSAEIQATANSIVLYKNDWHQGVLGIVASRLSDQYYRPTILLTDCKQADSTDMKKLVKGSGRSIEGIDIHKAVSSCEKMLERFGGHEGAVGLTLAEENIEPFRQQFNTTITTQLGKNSLSPTLFIDLQTNLRELSDQSFISAYTSLAPFGSGNPEPVFCMKAQKLSNPRLVGVNHLRFAIKENNILMNGIGVGFGSVNKEVKNTPMDLAFTLRLNSYMGQEKWEIQLVDIRPSRHS